MNKLTQSQEFMDYALKLKEAGFDVYIPEGENPTYCKFVKNDKIGYVENSDYGFNFSSVHKPNRQSGTGYSIHREIGNPTIKMAEDCFIIKPNWASRDDMPIKYKSWADYESKEINNIITKIKL